MVNGESTSIFLLLTYNANSSSTISVFNYQLSVIFYLLNSYPSPPQPAGCVTATPLLLLLSQNLLRHFVNPDKSGPNQKRRLMQLLVINQLSVDCVIKIQLLFYSLSLIYLLYCLLLQNKKNFIAEGLS